MSGTTKHIKVSEAETVMLIKSGGAQFAFGPSGLYLENNERNAGAIERVRAMRDEAQYLSCAHEHDL